MNPRAARPTYEAIQAARQDPSIQAKIQAVYGGTDEDEPVSNHEEDAVLVAFEWLDAQVNTNKPKFARSLGCKGRIENWAGLYVGFSHVVIAAELHPNIYGRYPNFNSTSSRSLPKPIRPNDDRLIGIPRARSQGYRDHDTKYAEFESRDLGRVYP